MVFSLQEISPQMSMALSVEFQLDSLAHTHIHIAFITFDINLIIFLL